MNYEEMKEAKEALFQKMDDLADEVHQLNMILDFYEKEKVMPAIYKVQEDLELQMSGLDEAMGRMEMDAADQFEEEQRSQGAWDD